MMMNQLALMLSCYQIAKTGDDDSTSHTVIMIDDDEDKLKCMQLYYKALKKERQE